MDEYYMNIALKEAKKAYKNGDIPIGCVIVENYQIISKAYNKKSKNNIAVMHAEILAIIKACKIKKTWHLDDCILYCTVEPCVMCIGAISQARISKIVYGIQNQKFGFSNFLKCDTKIMNYNIEIIKNICSKEAKKLLKNFFKTKRKKAS